MNPPGTPPSEIVTAGLPLYGGMSAATVQRKHAGAPFHLQVPYAIEAEVLQVTVAAANARTGPAVSVDCILEPSPDRIAPACAHFGTCGGCQYQHMPGPLQLRTKAGILQRLLHAAGVRATAPRLHAADGYHYRNRMRLRVESGRIGYSRRASNAFLPIHECPIVSPLLWRVAEALQNAALPDGTAEAEIFANAGGTAVQLTLHLDADVATVDREAPAVFRALCARLRGSIPELIGGGLLVHAAPTPGSPRRVQQRQRVQIAQWGEPGLAYEVNGHTYTVSRGAFFQVNRFLTGTLVDVVLGDRTGGTALDLFAGAGLFSLPLTQRFRQVVAVEVGQPAAADLARLLHAQGPTHRALAQTTQAFLEGYRPQTAPDLVILDPPRAGAGADVIRRLAQLAPGHIVYISCDPTTLAREARALIDSHYAVTELHLLDLFPQTFHMETVAVFRKL